MGGCPRFEERVSLRRFLARPPSRILHRMGVDALLELVQLRSGEVFPLLVHSPFSSGRSSIRGAECDPKSEKTESLVVR